MSTEASGLHGAEVAVLTILLVTYVLWALLRSLARRRPGLAIGFPVTVAFALRSLAVFGVSLTSVAGALRGGDEVGFIVRSHSLSLLPITDPAWTSRIAGNLPEVVFAAQYGGIDATDTSVRIFQTGLTVIGLVLLAAAVYELAGPRAARLAAWFLALEPANIFFSQLIHKEPLIYLSEGLLAFGCARLWRRGSLSSLTFVAMGCVIALATRPYAAYFLIAGAAAVVLHASRRVGGRDPLRGVALFALVILLTALTAPFVAYLLTSSHSAAATSLGHLQRSQTANATDKSNLKLEQVDYSTPGKIAVNLPTRMYDLLIRPYPWQIGNASQRFGLLGTVIVYPMLVWLALLLYRSRGRIWARAGPLMYLAGFVLLGYSLSVGNAGTGFRYRTHVVAFGLAMIVVLRQALAEEARAPATERVASPRVRSRASPAVG